jgi:hypothetical protein
MSSIAKANISLSKKDLTKSRILPVASRNVVFYHKATMGDQTIDLLALSMPSEMPTQVQATNEEINDARLYNNKKNLALVSSSKGQLIQGLDYLVTSGYTINLIGPGFTSGAEADEIFIGTINAAPISDLAVASSKTIVKSYELPVGQTTLNLGREYKLSEDGVLKVFVNGVLAQKDSDYEEVDSGNGYGSVIEFYAAPATIPYQIVVDFGVLAITDSNAIGDIESLAGSVKKIADDLAIVAGTDTLDYLNANPSEVERRWFGDALLKMLEIEIVTESKEIVSKVYSNVSQNIASSSSYTTLTFSPSDVVYDTSSAFSNSDNGFVIQEEGYYNVYSKFAYEPITGTTGFRELRITINGSANESGSYNSSFPTTGASVFLSASIIGMYFSKGDVIQSTTRQSSGSTLGITQKTLTIAKVSPVETKKKIRDIIGV